MSYEQCTAAESVLAHHSYRKNAGSGGAPLVDAVNAVLEARAKRAGTAGLMEELAAWRAAIMPASIIDAIQPLATPANGHTSYTEGVGDGFMRGLRAAKQAVLLASRIVETPEKKP